MCQHPAADLPGAVTGGATSSCREALFRKEAMGWLGAELLLKQDGFGQGTWWAAPWQPHSPLLSSNWDWGKTAASWQCKGDGNGNVSSWGKPLILMLSCGGRSSLGWHVRLQLCSRDCQEEMIGACANVTAGAHGKRGERSVFVRQEGVALGPFATGLMWGSRSVG